MSPQDQVKQALADLKAIDEALHIVNVGSLSKSQEEFDAAMKKGFEVLQKIEDRRGAIELVD